MLTPIDRLIGMSIMSLQTGAPLAITSGAIVDPRKLKIVAFRVSGHQLSHPGSVLYPEDIRELSEIGMIVDSNDSLMPTDGLVRLQEIIDFGFEPIGLAVEDERGHKLGRVESYAIDQDSFLIQQIYTKPSFLRSISSVGLTVHRKQIVSIDNKKIVIKSPTIREKVVEKATNNEFVNPFKSVPSQQPES